MKRFNKIFTLALVALMGLAMFSCTENEVMDAVDATDQYQMSDAAHSDFSELIMENISETEKGIFTLELTPDEFEEALALNFEKDFKGVKAYFENEAYRKNFRENIQGVIAEAGLIEASEKFCEMDYFAEAYSAQEGYTSSTSNSFAYARRDGTTNLWASAFSCITFDEVYTGYYSNCPWTGANCEGCRVRALYYSGGGDANIFGIGSCSWNP